MTVIEEEDARQHCQPVEKTKVSTDYQHDLETKVRMTWCEFLDCK